MDEPPPVILSDFCPTWDPAIPPLPADALPSDLVWMRVIVAPGVRLASPELDWLASLGRAASRLSKAHGRLPMPLEIWIDATADLGRGQATAMSGAFADGVARMALGCRVGVWSVAHEFGHFLRGQSGSVAPSRSPLTRLAGVLLEEYLAQCLARLLLAAIEPAGLEVRRRRELAGAAALLRSDYAAARDAARDAIRQGYASPALGRAFTPLVRSLAYVTGAREGEPITGLPRGLQARVDGPLAAALAQLGLPDDAWRDRVTLLSRVQLEPILGDLIEEVVSNALLATPRAERSPDWPSAFTAA